MITKKLPSLFHYTTSDALLGMIAEEKICMWATHHQYLNDPQEYHHGIDFIKNHFPDQRFEDLDEFYIISLSQRPDFLPLWSMYSQNGFGIMLGFDSEIQDINLKYAKCHCFYQITPSIIEQLNKIKEASEKLDSTSDNTLTEEDNKLKALRTSLIQTLPLSIKNPSYEFEEELRFVFEKENEEVPLFKIKNGLFIPYIKRYFSKEHLLSVTIGPMHEKEKIRAAKSLRMFLDTNNFKHVNIICSDLPYRG